MQSIYMQSECHHLYHTVTPLKQKHIIYISWQFLLRYVSNLETHVKKLDDEYDAVNLVLAKGQMDNYGNTLPD